MLTTFGLVCLPTSDITNIYLNILYEFEDGKALLMIIFNFELQIIKLSVTS